MLTTDFLGSFFFFFFNQVKEVPLYSYYTEIFHHKCKIWPKVSSIFVDMIMWLFFSLNAITDFWMLNQSYISGTNYTWLSSVQLLSYVWLFATPWTAAGQASLLISNSQSLPKFMSIELVMPSNHPTLYRPLLLLPSIFPSIFSNESALCIRWPKYWSFSFNISPSNEHPGLIFLRMDCLDLLAVQGTLKSLLQHHSSKVQFFSIQFSL